MHTIERAGNWGKSESRSHPSMAANLLAGVDQQHEPGRLGHELVERRLAGRQPERRGQRREKAIRRALEVVSVEIPPRAGRPHGSPRRAHA
jgi:hypothetical protein